MENNCKLINFDIEKAKTPLNPNGLEVVTKSGKKVTIVSINFRSINRLTWGERTYPILAIIHDADWDTQGLYTRYGCSADDDDLYLKEPISQRRMTHKELAWWLRDSPEEHREFKYYYDDVDKKDRGVHCVYTYSDSHANEPADVVLIRSNGGEWHEPLIDDDSAN